MDKTLSVLYCLYDHQFFTPHNLEHVYDDVDQIIIAYGPFQYYKEIKEKLLGYGDDNTLGIIKQFIKDRDVDNKIQLIEQDVWENYHSKRVAVQPMVDGDWFFNIGPDEFFLDGHLARTKQIINEYHDVINSVYHPRIEFCRDFRHYWNLNNINVTYDDIAGLYEGNALEDAQNQNAVVSAGKYSVLPFYNGPVIWNMNDASVIMTVSGYKNEDRLYWGINDNDALLYHYDGTPYADLTITYFDNSIIRHHYSTAQDPKLHFLQRAIYYSRIRDVEKDIDELIDEKKIQYPHWSLESIKNEFFNQNVVLDQNSPIIYDGEYPTVIKQHSNFFRTYI